MTFKPAHKDTTNPPGQIVNPFKLSYLDTINHPNFREANKAVHSAENLLKNMGMNKEQVFAWIVAWTSGAGDGSK